MIKTLAICRFNQMARPTDFGRSVRAVGHRRLTDCSPLGEISMIVALATPTVASSLDEGLGKIERFVSESSTQGAEIVCFPEAYLPGLRGQDFEVFPFGLAEQERVLKTVAQWARSYGIATILGMERITEAGRQIVAVVFDAHGQIQGIQTKNQLDPSEDRFYVPGNTRQTLRDQRRQVWRGHLPRGLALSRDGEVGRGTRGQDRLSSATHGQ